MWEGWTSVGDSECHQSTSAPVHQSTNSHSPTANGQRPTSHQPTPSHSPSTLHSSRTLSYYPDMVFVSMGSCQPSSTNPPTTSAHPLRLHWLRHPGLAHRNGDRLFLGSSIVHQLSDIAADGLL